MKADLAELDEEVTQAILAEGGLEPMALPVPPAPVASPSELETVPASLCLNHATNGACIELDSDVEVEVSEDQPATPATQAYSPLPLEPSVEAVSGTTFIHGLNTKGF